MISGIPPTAEATTAVQVRDFQAVTVTNQAGGESLFVADVRTGMIAVFNYDQTSRSLRLVASRPVSDAFRR